MSGEISPNENAVQTTSAPAEETRIPGRPQEQLEIEETNFSDENINYPTGPKLWMTVGSMCIAQFLNGLVRFSRILTRE